MDSRKVLYFLGILAEETKGHSDEIADIYKRALDENDDIQSVKKSLNNYVFFREIGNSLYHDGEEVINKIYASPLEALELLPKIRQARERIENTVCACNELIYSPFPTTETISVLKKKDIISYLEAFKSIAATSVYLMLVYGGVDVVKDLTWNDTVGIQETYYSINTRFIPALCSVKRPNYGWIIKKRRLGGRALFGGECFYLSYENTRSIDYQCKALHKEPIGTHAFLNVDAYEAGECDIPYCWGVGNIVSAAPGEALSFLQSDIVTKLRAPQIAELNRKLPTPLECVKQLADGKKFCVNADELLQAMNRWLVGSEIEKRKRNHNCLFCGKYIDGNKLVCPSHFSTEFK